MTDLIFIDTSKPFVAAKEFKAGGVDYFPGKPFPIEDLSQRQLELLLRGRKIRQTDINPIKSATKETEGFVVTTVAQHNLQFDVYTKTEEAPPLNVQAAQKNKQVKEDKQKKKVAPKKAGKKKSGAKKK